MSSPALIAIVDDDPPLRGALVNLVRSFGFDTVDFGSAAGFLSSAEALAADVVLSDVRMPDLDGLGLQKALNARRAAFPIILMSAELDPAVIAAAMAAGAVACLQKPFDSSLLEDALDRALHPGKPRAV